MKRGVCVLLKAFSNPIFKSHKIARNSSIEALEKTQFLKIPKLTLVKSKHLVSSTMKILQVSLDEKKFVNLTP